MYLVEVPALVYISHLRQCKRAVQFATSRSGAFGQRWACAVCVSCSQYLLLPLAIVNECAGKFTAYLCRQPRDQQPLWITMMCLFYLVINVCWHIIRVAIVCYHGMLMCLFYYLAVNLCCHIIWFACAIVNYHDMSMFYRWRLFSQLFGCQSLLELLFLLLAVILFLDE